MGQIYTTLRHRGLVVLGAVLIWATAAPASDLRAVPDGFHPVELSPNRVASATVFGALGRYLPPGPESLEGRPSFSMNVVKAGDVLRVDISAGDFLDDSVSGQELIGYIGQTDRGWKLLQLHERFICYRGAPDDRGRCP